MKSYPDLRNIYNYLIFYYCMGEYKIYHSSRFDKELSKYDKSFQDRVDKIENQLMLNPFAGDPIDVKWFREKRIDNYRIYFIIYDDLNAVFMVAISSKKNKQEVINTIKLLLNFFRNEIKNLVNPDSI